MLPPRCGVRPYIGIYIYLPCDGLYVMAQDTVSGDELLETLADAHVGSEDTDDMRDFVLTALAEIHSKIENQRDEARSMGMLNDDAPNTNEVLAPDNVRDIDVRCLPLENPRITVWLRDCPAWANNAGNDHCWPQGINAYNGKVHYVWDVRPF